MTIYVAIGVAFLIGFVGGYWFGYWCGRFTEVETSLKRLKKEFEDAAP